MVTNDQNSIRIDALEKRMDKYDEILDSLQTIIIGIQTIVARMEATSKTNYKWIIGILAIVAAVAGGLVGHLFH